MATCHLHPDRETFRSCTRCGRPACPSCLHEAAVGAHCTACVKADRGPMVTQVKREIKMKSAVNGLITPAIIAVNAAVHFYSFTKKVAGRGDVLRGANQLALKYGLNAYFVKRGEWYRIITSGFLHSGLMHLGFNMFALWNVGRLLERAIGRGRFLAVYLISIVAGSAGVIIGQPDTLAIGASGGVFGVFAFAAVLLNRRGTSITSNPLFATIAINLVITFSLPGISIGGHIGGLLGGFLCGLALQSGGFRRADNGARDYALLGGILAIAVVACVLGVARLGATPFA
jgi:membrane associated rhomboid family serine protease